jgi:hypothetical protein
LPGTGGASAGGVVVVVGAVVVVGGVVVVVVGGTGSVCAEAGPATSRALAATATTSGPTRDIEITWLFPP